MNNVSDIIKAIEERQAIQKRAVDILSIIEPVLKSFDGKTISKRIETAIKKVLPEFTVYYGKSYSWYELKIWGNGVDYQNNLSLNLGYTSTSDVFNFEWYVTNNQRSYLEKSRYEHLEVYRTDVEKLVNLSIRYEELLETISEFKKETSNLPYPVSQFFKI
jgi:hypothetical protein